jgi:hypothetical protein
MDKSLVTKATSPDEIPTAGYMFNEIARITQASADACKVRLPRSQARGFTHTELLADSAPWFLGAHSL